MGECSCESMSSPFITTVAAYYGIDYVPPASLDDFSTSLNGVESIAKHDHDVGNILSMADHLRRDHQGRPMDTTRQSEVHRHGPSELQAWRDAAEHKAYSPMEEGEHLCGRYGRMHGVCVPSSQERGFITPGGAFMEPSAHTFLRMGETRTQTQHSNDNLSPAARMALVRQIKSGGVAHATRLCDTARRQGDIDRACAHEAATRHASMSQDERQQTRSRTQVSQLWIAIRERSHDRHSFVLQRLQHRALRVRHAAVGVGPSDRPLSILEPQMTYNCFVQVLNTLVPRIINKIGCKVGCNHNFWHFREIKYFIER